MDISELVEDGVSEGEKLEYKSTDAHPDGIVKELVALANHKGGRVIVGIRENDGDIEAIEDVESGGNPSGLEETLHNLIRDNVKPVFELTYDTAEYDSKTLIDISVGNEGALHSWSGTGKPTFPIRHGSTTRYLSGFEIARAYGHPTDESPESIIESGSTAEHPENPEDQREEDRNSHTDLTRRQTWSNGVYRVGSVQSLPNPESPTYSAPPNRLILESGGRQITTFGQLGLEPVQANHSTVRLRDSITLLEISDLRQCLKSIDSRLDTSSYLAYSYSIKYGSRQLIGRGIENFLEDARRITEICDRLTPGDGTAGERARPIGVLSFPVSDGVGLLELQWDGDTLRRGRSSLQLLLQNVPLNTTPYEKLGEKWDWNPRSFEEQTRLQWLRINGSFGLQETRPITFDPSSEFPQKDIVATNPFYESPEQVDSAFDIDVPWYLCEGLAGLNRLPFDVAGGLHPDDNAFGFDFLEVLHLDGMIETFIIASLSRVTSTDADIPSLDPPFEEEMIE